MSIARSRQTTIEPFVSVIIVNTNELHHLVRCLPSVCEQSYERYEVILVDNASTDGSVEFVAQHFPSIRIVKSTTNLGYPGANNLGFQHATGEYIAVLNPDTEVDHHWLAPLVHALEDDRSAGMATSKILLIDNPALINTCGNIVTVSGLTFCRGVGKPRSEFNIQDEVNAVSGAAFLIRRAVLEEIGPFDADFFAYLEETDLSLRAILAGYTCLYVPDSLVYHRYSFRFSERKCFDIEKNRWYMLAKIFRMRTLVLLSPILFLTELLVWCYMFMCGRQYTYQKWRSYTWLWNNRAQIRASHIRTQRIRRVSDRVILQKLSPQLHFQQMVPVRQAQLLQVFTTPILFVCSQVAVRFAN